MKKLIIAALFAALFLCGCASNQPGEKIDIGKITEASETDASGETASEEQKNNRVATVKFNGESAVIDGEGVSFEKGILTVSRGGMYTLSGELRGAIVVDIPKTEKAELVLSGVSISNADTSALYIKCADKVTLYLSEGTENVFVDGDDYALADDAEPSACIYSADDLEIEGEGTLEIYAKCRNGIQTKNDLRIKSGNITVTAPKNALKGKDSVVISGGCIKITGAKDGIKSDNEKEEGRGTVKITGGTISLACQDDGIQAFRSVIVTAEASITASCGDDAVNCDGETDIADGAVVEK